MFRLKRSLTLVLLSLLAASGRPSDAQDLGPTSPQFREIGRFDVPEAIQGVAVDNDAFYAIANREIAKYDKRTGVLKKRWTATADWPLVHLNAGIVHDGKLYCAHSNFPAYPEASSVEVWNAATLEHVESHSLGIGDGSLTWIDWHDGKWWALFAHYTEQVNDNRWAKDARWMSIVLFDSDWRRTGGWALPKEVIKRMEPHSSSGGGWSAHGSLYVSGHDRGEVYELGPPRAGATLTYVRTLPAPITGQAIAWDPANHQILYGIDRPRRQVVVMKLTTSSGIVAASSSTLGDSPSR
jgi:hypothetical protein